MSSDLYDVAIERAKWWMWLFYFFVNAQRFFELSPRLALVPKMQEQRASASMAASS